jgi:hypothetical protein
MQHAAKLPIAIAASLLASCPLGAWAQEPPEDAPVPPAKPEPAADALRAGALLGVGFPRIFSLDALLRKGDWAFGACVEYTPPKLLFSTDKTTISWVMVDAQARWFFYRFLFVGAHAGYHLVRTDSSNFGSEVDYVVDGPNLGLKAGALYTFKSGLTVGADLGISTGVFQSIRYYTAKSEDDSNARKVARTFGENPIPYGGLRAGWFF